MLSDSFSDAVMELTASVEWYATAYDIYDDAILDEAREIIRRMDAFRERLDDPRGWDAGRVDQ